MAIVMSGATTILIADPDVEYRKVVAECFTPRYHVITADNLAETVTLVRHYHPAILLLELDQPDGDGLTIIPRLKAHPETHSMVVTCLTTRTSIDEKIAGFQAGADDYVVKPINTRTFMYRVLLLARVHSR